MSNEIDQYGRWTKEGLHKKNKTVLKQISELANDIGKDHSLSASGKVYLCDNDCDHCKVLARGIMELSK